MLGDPYERWHDRPLADLALQFQTDVRQGLTSSEAARRLQQSEPNAL